MTFCFIGSEELAIGFRFVGVPGTVVTTAEEAREAFLGVTRAGEARVVVITEDVAALIPREVMEWQMGGAYPLIVEIPSPEGVSPNEPSLSEIVLKAIGIKL